MFDIPILALGDRKQESVEVQGREFYADGLIHMTHELASSIRSDNIYQKDNQSALSALLRYFDDELELGKNIDVREQFDRRKKDIILKYYEEERNGIRKLHGYKFANTTKIKPFTNSQQDIDEANSGLVNETYI
jgi:hypothetical protein